MPSARSPIGTVPSSVAALLRAEPGPCCMSRIWVGPGCVCWAVSPCGVGRCSGCAGCSLGVLWVLWGPGTGRGVPGQSSPCRGCGWLWGGFALLAGVGLGDPAVLGVLCTPFGTPGRDGRLGGEGGTAHVGVTHQCVAPAWPRPGVSVPLSSPFSCTNTLSPACPRIKP